MARCFASLVVGLVLGLSASGGVMPPDYGFQWAIIDHPGNAPYRVPEGEGGTFREVGGVNYTYRISKLEMSADHWAEFANANAAIGDPWLVAFDAYYEGINDIGPNGFVPRTDIPLGASLPVAYANFYIAARYCNWLHNGQAVSRAAMEYGAYDLRGLGLLDRPAVPPTRLPGAQFFIPSHDEWVKAAHFDPDRYGEGVPGYWLYSHTSDTAPIPGPRGIGESSAGYYDINDSYVSYRVGAYPDTQSPWGLLDTSGCMSEWTETIREDLPYPNRIREGEPGFSTNSSGQTDHIWWAGDQSASSGSLTLGFRIASVVPAPAVWLWFAVCSIGWTQRKRSS
jgi:sulfatase modifying factor 1